MVSEVALYAGAGPGPQSADGCSVDLYRRLPYAGDLEPVRAHLSAGMAVLELGCGTGRLTGPLLEWGCRVTAVDCSADMLRHVPAAAHAVLSCVEHLTLDERFDVVLLASRLINHADADMRRAFVACAARHLHAGGHLLLERHDPKWLAALQPGPLGQGQGIATTVEFVQHGAAASEVRLRYECDGLVWHHRFTAARLDAAAIEGLLADAGFRHVDWLGAAGRWLAASAEPTAPAA